MCNPGNYLTQVAETFFVCCFPTLLVDIQIPNWKLAQGPHPWVELHRARGSSPAWFGSSKGLGIGEKKQDPRSLYGHLRWEEDNSTTLNFQFEL